MRREYWKIGWLTVALLAGAAAADTQAANLRVPSEYPTIQAAVDAAVSGDTVLIADGRYSGDGYRSIRISLKAITVRSENGSGQCVLLAENGGRLFWITSDKDTPVTIEGLSLQNGFAGEETPGGGYGGAIFCEYYDGDSPSSFSVAVRNCAFWECRARWAGGAIYCQGGKPEIAGNRFMINNAGTGGAIACINAGPLIENNLFAVNEAVGAGAIWCSRDEEVGGSAWIQGNTFIENRSETVGAVECTGNSNFPDRDTITIRRNSFVGNTALNESRGTAGALMVKNASIEVANNHFARNRAGESSGAMVLEAPHGCVARVVNNTVAFNEGRLNAAIFFGYGHSGDGVVVNNIVWGNVPSTYQIFSPYGGISIDYCDVEGYLQVQGEGNLSVDPRFMDSHDLRLSAFSRCIDAARGNAAPPTDLQGNPRYDDQGVANTGVETPNYVDMGCYERQIDSATLLASVLPDSGSYLGGDLVVLIGDGFTSDTTVTFGGKQALEVACLAPSRILVLTPPHNMPPGSERVDVTVTNHRGSSTLADGFTYQRTATTHSHARPGK